MATAENFVTPVGRLVQGDCFEPQTKNQHGQPLVDKAGNPTQKYFVGVAFKKTDPAFAAIKAQFERVARAAFPQFFNGPGGTCTHPQFSLKIVDGDGIDNNGRPNSSKEGFAGCWILRASSSFAPKCFAAGKYQPHEQLSVQGGINPIPRGHYIRVAGTVTDNGGGQGKPGLYVNCNLIEWAAVGDVIISGPDASEVFGQVAPNMQPAAPLSPASAPQPHAAILSPPIMTAKAANVPYADYVRNGWTDEQLIAHGYMQARAVPVLTPPQPAAPVPQPPSPPVAAGVRMGMNAQGFTYEQWKQAGYTDDMMRTQGIII